jgi:cysteine desulfurase
LGNHIVLAATEHPALIGAVAFLEQHGFTSSRVPVDSQGFVDPEDVRSALTEKTTLICAHHANHDIGTIQPIAEIGQLAAERGIAFFLDATSSGGWIPIDAPAANISLLSLAPHRFYGPKGVGVLYRHRRARLRSLVHGGRQESGYRAGTENVPAIVGAGVAAESAARGLARRADHVRVLSHQLWRGLQSRIDRIQLNGPPIGPQRHPGNLNLSVESVEGEGLALALDLKGIAIHSGPSCVAGSARIPPVLEAIGSPPSLARGNVLFSLGEDNTPEEIDRAIKTCAATVEKLREMGPSAFGA